MGPPSVSPMASGHDSGAVPTVMGDSNAVLDEVEFHFEEHSLCGTTIGPCFLVEKIGRGGFGDVYRAEQQTPVQRSVALKILKPGMDSDVVVRRFAAERQALARMEHSGIARVYDAGATGDGRPYFVMELVRGTSITRYCDTRNLQLRERIELFSRVCLAIDHAHQRGVVHRDVKPSNILVVTEDDVTMPRIIDFGIAKATQQSLTDLDPKTLTCELLGTPRYMSQQSDSGLRD